MANRMNAWVLMLDDDGVEQERCPAEFKDDVCVCETGCDDPAYVWTTASGMTYALCRTCIEADEYVRFSERPAALSETPDLALPRRIFENESSLPFYLLSSRRRQPVHRLIAASGCRKI